jgi:phage baseplate assembly protein W
MADSFVGKGWRFPIAPDSAGGLGYVEGDANVEQSLRILLLTELGQRVMRPDFGSKAGRLVFAPGGVQYLGLLENTVREAIRDWEPRIDVEFVRAETDPNDETRVTVGLG